MSINAPHRTEVSEKTRSKSGHYIEEMYMLDQLRTEQAPTDITVTVDRAPTEITLELIKIIPSLLWVILIAGLITVFYKPIRDQLVPNMSSINIFGVEASFVRQQLDRVAQAGIPAGSPEERSQVARRAQRLSSIVRGAQVLIVNDNPRDMLNFEQILRNLGMQVDVARTTEGALTNMESRVYDVVVSDMERDGVSDEGRRFLDAAVQRDINRPTIFGIRDYDPNRGVPPYAFGITNRTDELLNLVLDALERSRG
jgi:hypothetical protein